MSTLKRFEAKMKVRDAQEKNTPATAKEIQEQSEHLGNKRGNLVENEALPNRKERRNKERPDNTGLILNNRGGAGRQVLNRMGYFGMKLREYQLGIRTTRYARYSTNIMTASKHVRINTVVINEDNVK